MQDETRKLSPLELERLVFDAEVATNAILETPKLQPASIANLVTLAEDITEDLAALERQGAGQSAEARKLRELQAKMFSILRRLSSEP